VLSRGIAHTRESRKDRGTYARRSRLLRSTVSCSNWLPLYPPLSPVRGMEWGYGWDTAFSRCRAEACLAK